MIDGLAEIEGVISANPLVIIEFGAQWCRPCQAFLPHFERFAAKHPEFLCVKVDIDMDPDVMSTYGIQSVPQVWTYVDGHKAAEIVGRTVLKMESELNL